MNYYNEHDPKAAAWLRVLISENLIAKGEVDERDIQKITANDVRGYTQCHWFAGIGGWSLALRLVGWPDDQPVWTGSCPCQPFSCAGKGEAQDDERHLWPDFFRLIKACRPQIVFGEQVASADVIGSKQEASFVNAVQRGDFATANRIANQLIKSPSLHYHKRWLDGIRADMEGQNYTIGAGVIGAHSVGAPHKRQRLYWVADGRAAQPYRSIADENAGRRDGFADGFQLGGMADMQCSERRPHSSRDEQHRHDAGRDEAAGRLGACRQDGSTLVQPDRNGRDAGEPAATPTGHGTAAGPAIGDVGVALGDADIARPQGLGECRDGEGERTARTTSVGCLGAWSDFDILPFRDGKFRRVEAGTFPLAHGVPGRVGLLRGYGNAIVPQVAAEFIKAYLSVICP